MPRIKEGGRLVREQWDAVGEMVPVTVTVTRSLEPKAELDVSELAGRERDVGLAVLLARQAPNCQTE